MVCGCILDIPPQSALYVFSLYPYYIIFCYRSDGVRELPMTEFHYLPCHFIPPLPRLAETLTRCGEYLGDMSLTIIIGRVHLISTGHTPPKPIAAGRQMDMPNGENTLLPVRYFSVMLPYNIISFISLYTEYCPWPHQ